MSPRSTIHQLFAVAAAVAAVAVVVLAAPVQAATYPGYSHVSASYPFGSGYYAGGHVDCPTGQVPVASGAVNSDPAGMLLSGSTTDEGTRSFASGQSAPDQGAVLEVRAQCVPRIALKGRTRASLTLRDHTSGSWRTYSRRATCPAGTVAYGGGGNVVQATGSYDAVGLYTHSTAPEGRSWAYAGTGALGGRMLRVETGCVPRARLGRITTVTGTATGPAVVQGRHPLVASARCPEGYVAFAGGGSLGAAGSDVSSWVGYLRANLMAADDRGWLVVGDTFVPNTQLTVKVRCTDRLG